jgi:hypothetical protein
MSQKTELLRNCCLKHFTLRKIDAQRATLEMNADVDARPHVKRSLLRSVCEFLHDALSVCTTQRPLLLRMMSDDELERIQKE